MADAADIARIYNAGIAERKATFETEPRSVAQIEERLQKLDRFPVLVVVDPDDVVVGWAGLSEYRPRECYAGIADFSIYLTPEARGRGIGKRLLGSLVEAARERGFWKLVSRVFPSNAPSRALCRSSGFREVGIYERHGKLDGRWMDAVIVEKLIDG
jgi:phosphinothricin acetyltransferase